ncbi:uncharacterized protein M6B38_316905 [Iris pallida]|uniref:DUF3741 domain-containing protein n=1 Tax=Iris pallida TaxID=29817 RepID=A0AAX6HD70_IRIPA|nr:uncharacterized protein M6B38_316905 [Iris pallida]
MKMKLSPSSSSFNLSSNDSVASAGCLSGILSRFACGNIHNVAVEQVATGLVQEQEKPLPPACPGLVARLMGLESMPVLSDTTSSTTSSVRRSRSTNSTESWNGFLSGLHKNWAAKSGTSSQSFRETPTFLRAESEDFLILSFSPEDNADAPLFNRVEPKLDCRETKEAKNSEKKRRKNEKRVAGKESALERKNKDNNVGSPKGSCYGKSHKKMMNAEGPPKKPMKQRNMSDRSISTKKSSHNATRKLELECSSQNSSPVSVLDHHIEFNTEYLTGLGSPISGDDKKPWEEKPRKKLSPDLDNHSFPTPKAEVIYNKEAGLRPINVGKKRENCSGRREETLSDVLKHSCQLAEEDIKRSSIWISREMWVSDEVSGLIELHILDMLIHEAVADLHLLSNFTP